MATLRFIIRSTKTDTSRIECEFSIARGSRTRIGTPFTIIKKDWNANRERLIVTAQNASEINSTLSDIEEDIFRQYNSNPYRSWPELKEIVTEIVTGNRKKSTDVFDIWNDYLNANAMTLHARTIQKFKSTKDYVQKLDYRPSSFDGFSLKFFDLLLSELVEKGYLNDSIEKHVRCCMQFLRWSFDRGYHKNQIFERTDIGPKKATKNEIVALTEDELEALMNIELPRQLSEVRYLFCLSCFSGARWSDCMAFRKEQVQNDTWSFEAYKNRKMKRVIHIPNRGYLKGAFTCMQKLGYRPPFVTEQYVNHKIKEICMEAGIIDGERTTRMSGKNQIIRQGPKWKFISFHSGRRTFISILLSRGVPATVVMELTGISNLKTLQKYIKTDQSAIIRELDKATEKGIMKGKVVGMG